VLCGLAATGLAATLVLALRPASVPAIRDASGAVVPGSIAVLEKISLGGNDQWIEIRGHDTDNPVLLYLSGGPGQSDLPFSRALLSDLTTRFTVVGWDQRGAGKSYRGLDPETLTLAGMIADTNALTTKLQQRFGDRPVYLLGESWGSTLAVLAAQRRPDLYAAVVSSGQMVSPRETDRRIYRDALAYAARTHDAKMAATLRGFRAPPYRDVFAYGYVMGLYDKLAGPYTAPAAYRQRGTAAAIGPSGVLGSEYALIDRINVMRGLADTFATLYPQLQGIDFRRDVPRLDVPIYLLEGEHELAGRRSLADEWYRQVQAPTKRRYTFPDAGHSVAFEQYQALNRVMSTALADSAELRR
jgi:pimeloyl-ACP methyl ester carboxylesterase